MGGNTEIMTGQGLRVITYNYLLLKVRGIHELLLCRINYPMILNSMNRLEGANQ